jgi:hypothetical protein
MTVTKSSFVKTSMFIHLRDRKWNNTQILILDITGGTETGERRSSYSPNKISHPTTGATTEVCFYTKKRSFISRQSLMCCNIYLKVL